MPPTLREIARAAGVDISTVSRVLAGKAQVARIAEPTVRRVQETADRLGFRPNLTARALRTKRTRTIGLLVSDLVNPFFAGISGAVEAYASSAGYTLMVATSGESTGRQSEYLSVFLARQVDGLIVAPAPGSAREPSFNRILEERVPLVLIDRLVPGLETSHVVAENRDGAAALVAALASQGARRIALAAGPTEAWTMAERLAGFKRGLKDAGLPFDPHLVHIGSFSVETGRRAAVEFLQRRPPPDAIVGANNRILTGVLEALHADGARARRIAAAGFDGVPLAALLGRPLATVEQPVDDIGRHAARIVIEQLEGRRKGIEKIALPLALTTSGFGAGTG